MSIIKKMYIYIHRLKCYNKCLCMLVTKCSSCIHPCIKIFYVYFKIGLFYEFQCRFGFLNISLYLFIFTCVGHLLSQHSQLRLVTLSSLL